MDHDGEVVPIEEGPFAHLFEKLDVSKEVVKSKFHFVVVPLHSED